VITGIILGPSAFGRISGFTTAIFPDSSMDTFNVIANVGLIVFMFMVGLGIDTNLMRRNASGALAISISAMITPFLLVS
jgi:Kef-type K+ transport system membrane component KefB